MGQIKPGKYELMRNAAAKKMKSLLRDALLVVEQDLDDEIKNSHTFKIVTGFGGTKFVGLGDGRYWGGGTNLWAADKSEAVLVVAEGLQECLMEVLWVLWPECPEHPFGLHLRADAEGRAVWLCKSEGAHIVAPVGQLKTVKQEDGSNGDN
ncbi:hypothetical protein ABT061_01730 [Streptosporangium sp. NPDC002544]|uniref:hypothetical protein n=1 Tax=Streptosporangium sp. NPDC002544 TaxID=3154538 RepID=UPI00331FA6B3